MPVVAVMPEDQQAERCNKTPGCSLAAKHKGPCKVEEKKSDMSTTTANISAAQVKDLREKTGAPMMDCKQALTEAKGNLEQAVIILRKKGMASMQKKAARVTSAARSESRLKCGYRLDPGWARMSARWFTP